MLSPRSKTVAVLGTTQTLAWASTYYLPAVLGAPIAASLGMSTGLFFGLFSGALLLGAAISPWIGQLIDRRGGRGVLVGSNAVIAAGLTLLALAPGPVSAGIAWAFLGVGMAMGLYDPAFATLTRLYGHDARPAITGITLIAGFASTVGWPTSAGLEHAFGWRETCLIWASLNLFVALPLNWLLLPSAPPLPRAAAATSSLTTTVEPPRNAMPVIAFYFAATAFVTGAMASHLPRLLEAAGATATMAIAAAALVGPAQVAARLIEFSLLRSIHPVWSARLAASVHPIGAAALGAFGPAGVALFAILHGGGNGLVTIARGTLPLAIFGPVGYGLRNGLLSIPARVALSAAPFIFGMLLDKMGVYSVLISAGLSVAAVGSLLFLDPGEPQPASERANGLGRAQ
jgi:MFS family permease